MNRSGWVESGLVWGRNLNKIQGVTSYRFKSKNYLEMCLAPPWKPIECMVKLPETPDHTIDKWGFATTISEISSWCQESDTRMGYPEESSNFRIVLRTTSEFYPELTTSRPLNKQGRVFPMVIWLAFRMEK